MSDELREQLAELADEWADSARDVDGPEQTALKNCAQQLRAVLSSNPEPAARPVRKVSWLMPIDVKEERLNQLSDLAIGEAMGGDVGAALAENARHNLAILDEMATGDRSDVEP